MRKDTFLKALFVLMVAAQWWVPLGMIKGNERTLAEGKAFRFEVAPVDPNDPFRGRYIDLAFEATSFKSTTRWEDLSYNQPVFVELGADSVGMARIVNVSLEAPTHTANYVRAAVEYYDREDNALHFGYPFTRFYMEESKAKPAEQVYRDARNGAKGTSFALVYVREGEAVIADVFVNGTSIAVLAGQQNQ